YLCGADPNVETRPQRLTQRRATDPLISVTRPVFSAFSAAFQSRSWVSPKANRGRVCRLIANPTPVVSRVGEMGIGSAWPVAESGIGVSQGGPAPAAIGGTNRGTTAPGRGPGSVPAIVPQPIPGGWGRENGRRIGGRFHRNRAGRNRP